MTKCGSSPARVAAALGDHDNPLARLDETATTLLAQSQAYPDLSASLAHGDAS